MRRGIGLFVLAAALAAGGCGSGNSGGSDHSSSIAQSIMSDGASQLQASMSSLAGGGTVTMGDANCVQTAGTQTYSCIAHYSYQDPTGATYTYALDSISATCDNSGSCQWHSNGSPSLTGEQPARPPEGSACTPAGGGQGVVVYHSLDNGYSCAPQ